MDESVKEKKYVEARDLALKAMELDPDNPDLYLPIGTDAASQRLDQGPNVRRRPDFRLTKRPTGALSWHFVFFMKGSPDGR